ncbi:hypothetical protein Hanom_Chr14g01303771 [Helianthus anomalus]
MELMSRIKMARFQTFWIKMRKNKPLDENRKTSQTSWMKMAFYSKRRFKIHTVLIVCSSERQSPRVSGK